MTCFSKKRFRGALLLFFAVLLNAQILLTANVAKAQWVTANPDLLAKDVQKDLTDKVAGLTKSALIQALATGLINLFIYEVNTVAYNSAVWVASGGNAQDPLYDTRPAADYLRDAGASMAAAAVSEVMSADVADLASKYGVNLPDDPNLRAAIANGIRSTYIPTQNDSSFDFNDIKDNWKSYLISVASDTTATPTQKTGAVLKAMSKSFDPGANQFTSAFQVYSQTIIEAQVAAQQQADEFKRNDHFSDIVNATSGQIETPASFVREKLAHSIEKASDTPFDLTGSMLTNSDTLTEIGLMAGSVFSNTLISELLQKLQGGIFKDIAIDTQTINPFDADSLASSSRTRAQERNKSLLAFKPLATADVNLLSQFASCPTAFQGISRQLYNCVMDTSFSSAVARADSGDPLTVSEAIEQGYLNGDWPLIPSSDTARDQDANCYTYGFCHSNLMKLRKARIISIGWELAAESSKNSSSSPITLSEVMDGFNDCSSDGQVDASHPWCHLIDPNWVLRYPQVQCRTMAYGQRLSASGTDSRAEECVDLQSCISEDENGNCTGGWGYCVEEKNTWKFRGDECPEQYASCQSFTTVKNEAVDYLTNTIDSGICDADNAGCLWYASIKKEIDGVFEWPNVNDEPDAELQRNADRYRLYVDSDAESCSASDAGCSTLVERTNDLRLNMINNASFEADADGDSWPDTWMYSTSSTKPTYDVANNEGRTGDAAASPGSGTLYQMGASLTQNTFYTFSFYAKQKNPRSPDALRYAVYLVDPQGEESPDETGYSYTGDCAPSDLDSDGKSESMLGTVTPSVGGYERFSCTFTTPRLEHSAKRLQAYLDFFSANVWIDDVQLEQAEDASIFHTEYGNDTDNITLAYGTLPPAYLGCDGSADQPAECDNYATMCSADDEGCQAYTPSNGDSTIFGVAKSVDVCSSSCSGYDTYKQEGTRYEPNGSFPEYLIPSTADSCGEAAVGCDEFTNLTTEEREFYTYLRSCLTPAQAATNTTHGDGEATFYTWEGSDVEGFQLKTWHLLESNLDASSYESRNENGTAPGAAPCTTWQTTNTTVQCHDDLSGDGVYDDYTADCDEHSDIVTNPDCREFYDANGDIHYRLWSDTVTVDNACVAYRKTDIAGLGQDTDSDGTDDGQANCEDSGGYFDADLNVCRYNGLVTESTDCREADNGCREYTGGRSNNSRLAFQEFFESGDLTNWESSSSSVTTLSNESIATDGHSLLTTKSVWTFLFDKGTTCSDTAGCASATGNLGGTCTVSNGQRACGTLQSQLFAGKTYTLSFWAKGSGTVQPGFDILANPFRTELEVPFGDAIELGDTWHEYVLGPLDMNAATYPTFGNGTLLLFKVGSGATVYLDNVVLREGEDNITILKDSWVTPAVCDQDTSGNSSPQFQLGCAQYTDADGATNYLKSFSKLCSEDKVGCTGYFDTANSNAATPAMRNIECRNIDADSSGAPDVVSAATDCHLFTNTAGTAFDTESPVLCTISGGNDSCLFDTDYIITHVAVQADSRLAHIYFPADAVTVPADRDIYAILSNETTCDDSAAGCTELGQPTFSSDGSVVDSYKSVYLINDPDSYDTMLCSTEAVGCNAFTATNEGTSYFKDPMGQTCEYKSNVTIGGASYSGWFRTDENEFCSGTGTCSNGVATCSTDADCRRGTCSDNGRACYSDFDCSTDATCNVVDASSVCTVTEGTYLVGGETSGIWRNGDSAYEGWVGSCSAEWSGCSEFQDPMDYSDSDFYSQTDGTAYNFIDNDNLDENSLLSSQQCDDQVSQKLGCVLFNDTGISGFDFSASASYTASIHADVFFGDSPFSLVDPVDCDAGSTYSTINTPSGTQVDLCANRCVYKNEDLYPVTVGDIALLNNTTLSQDDIYTFGTSCYEDADCATYASENGDAITGSCKTQTVISVDTSNNKTYEAVPRLENDTNRILKVNRDRACEKWLTCDSSQTVWDETSASYKTICNSVDLCTAYSADNGDASFCSAWDTDNEPLILDAERYSARDVTWYGEEYSSYAIPDVFPSQFLTQVNIAPEKRCGYASDTAIPSSDTPCETTSDCTVSGETCEKVTESDYRLAYVAGSCSESYGSSCSVGYCSESGTLCSMAADCPGATEACLVGACYSTPSATTTCTSDDDCSDSQTCIGDVCLNEEGDCRNAATSEGYTCASDTGTAGDGIAGNASCYISANVYEGTCYRDTCVVNPDGQPFNTESSESQVCRAYPEIDSPFPESLVDTWTQPKLFDLDSVDFPITNSTLLSRLPTQVIDPVFSKRLIPYTSIAGFERAHICTAGEDCECSYKKLSSSTGVMRYIARDTAVTDIVQDLLTEVSSTESTADNTLGICSGGENDGSFCLVEHSSAYCGDNTSASGGTCFALNKEDSIIGMKGYCLERDTGINILGDSTLGACLTWLPVDQLEGSTDLYAKYTTAGFANAATYCAEVNLYYNVSSIFGCAERRGETGTEGGGGDATSEANKDDCRFTMKCPQGFFAVGGPADYTATDSAYTYQGVCDESANACPYMCVPDNSVHASGTYQGEVCDPSDEKSGISTSALLSADYSGYPDTKVHYTYNIGDTQTLLDFYSDCTYYGASVKNDELGLIDFPDHAQLTGEVFDHDYTFYFEDEDLSDTTDRFGGSKFRLHNTSVYPACVSTINMSNGDSEDYNYAWTDRLANLDSNTFSLDAGNFDYTYGTPTAPFGIAWTPTEVASGEDSNGDPVPVVIPACGADTTLLLGTTIYPPEDAEDPSACNDSSSEGYGPLFGNDSSPQGREFIAWDVTNQDGSGNVNTSDTSATIVSRLQQLFAKPLSLFLWQDESADLEESGGKPLGTYEEKTGDDFPDDFSWDVRAAEGNPPSVWALDTDHCYGNFCREGAKNNLTLNSSSNGDQPGSGGFFRATLKFFAAADKNQLPLRRVIVDWGDEEISGSDSTDNFYKNHRGLEPSSESTSICNRCDSSYTGTEACEWGETADSCDPNYFSFQHNYTCTIADTHTLTECTDTDSDGSPDVSPCFDSSFGTEGACVYQPRVHVRDNWGWCSGTCTAGADGKDGCYDSDGSLVSINHDYDECDYTYYPASGGVTHNSAVDPWIYYDGIVTVEP